MNPIDSRHKSKARQSSKSAVFASLRETQIIKSKPLLPAEILAQVLDHLDPPCLVLRCARVSKRMQEMVYDDTRWVRRLTQMGAWNEGEARRRKSRVISGIDGTHQTSPSRISQDASRRPAQFASPGKAGKELQHLPDLLFESPGAVKTTKHVTHERRASGKLISPRHSTQSGLGVGFDTVDLGSNSSALLDASSEDQNVQHGAPLAIFDQMRSRRGHGRQEYGRIHKTLWPLYMDILKSPHYLQCRIITDWSEPRDQGKIFANLVRFAKGDQGLGSYDRQKKMNDFARAFEHVAMQNFQHAMDSQDVMGRMREYAHVLVAMNATQPLTTNFIEQCQLSSNSSQYGDPIYCLDGMGDYLYDESSKFFSNVATAFNHQVEIVYQVFPPGTDILRLLLDKVHHTIVRPFLETLFSEARRTYLESYLKAVSGTCQQCFNWLENIKLNTPAEHRLDDACYDQVAMALYQSHIHDYLTEELAWFKSKSDKEVNDWEQKLSEQDASMESMYMSNVNRQADKTDFLTSFKKVVMMPVNVLPTFPMSSPFGGKPATAKALVNGEPVATAELGKEVFHAPDMLRPTSPSIVNGTVVSANRPASPMGEPPTTELAAKAAIMNSRLESIRSLFSIEVALNLVHSAKVGIERMVVLVQLGGVYYDDVRLHCELIFIALLQTLGDRHVRAGFDQAIDHLAQYKPRGAAGDGDVAATDQSRTTPLITFLELVNVGDLIQQMIDVFYEQELVTPGFTDRNDFLNAAVKEKKAFEQMLDSRVATGLNKGIEVLMHEVEYICATTQKPDDFNPATTVTASSTTVADLADIAPSATAKQIVETVSSHTKMLVGSTDKHMLDVFNQEVGMRLFALLCKHLKRQRISVTGSLRLISDMNLYHAYIVTLKNKDLVQFFVALRELSQIYLVGPRDAKALAIIIADGQRFKGIFGAEEVYTFAARRADWYQVKGKVERAMYGIGCEMM